MARSLSLCTCKVTVEAHVRSRMPCARAGDVDETVGRCAKWGRLGEEEVRGFLVALQNLMERAHVTGAVSER